MKKVRSRVEPEQSAEARVCRCPDAMRRRVRRFVRVRREAEGTAFSVRKKRCAESGQEGTAEVPQAENHCRTGHSVRSGQSVRKQHGFKAQVCPPEREPVGISGFLLT